jgi:hypothetical protein
MFDLTKLQMCENALRDMFRSQQYKGKVPVKDIEYILNLKKDVSWNRLYGKANVHKAWAELVKEKYVEKKGNFWIWTFGVE